MTPNAGMKRLLLALAALGILAALVVLWLVTRASPTVARSAPVADAAPAAAMSPLATRSVEAEPPEPAAPAAAPAGIPLNAPQSGEPLPVAGLNLGRLRQKIPEHSYWKLMAPTEDAELLAWRAERERELNVLYGKTLSGEATEEEIRQYFDEKRRISEDAISFASAALVELGDELSEDEARLFQLAITLHSTRLAELPRRIADAEARKREQDRRREEWLRSKK
jgi:hypothetical protein